MLFVDELLCNYCGFIVDRCSFGLFIVSCGVACAEQMCVCGWLLCIIVSYWQLLCRLSHATIGLKPFIAWLVYV